MKKIFSDLANFSIRVIPPEIANSIYSVLFGPLTIGLMFHAISDEPLLHTNNLFPLLDLKRFENTLIYLKNNFTFVNYKSLSANSKERLAKSEIFLSFDDGYSECFDFVRPLLLKHNIPCTFFITTNWIDNKSIFYRNKISICLNFFGKMPGDKKSKFLDSINNKFKLQLEDFIDFQNWMLKLQFQDKDLIDDVFEIIGIDQNIIVEKKIFMSKENISQLNKDGFTIGAHSKSHVNFQFLSQELMEEEIADSVKIIQEITGAEEIPFSFPYAADEVNINKINDLRNKLPQLGLLFGSNGLIRTKGITNRVWGENPTMIKLGKETPIPYMLHKAYSLKLFDKLSTFFSIK